MTNRQLLRLKQRSNGDILQVAECDDQGDLYTQVNGGTLNEVEHVTDVDEVNNVTSVDEVDKSVSYVTDVNGGEIPQRGSLTGYTLIKTAQSAIELTDSEVYGPWPDSAPQFTGFEHIYTKPSGDIMAKYMIYVANISPDTALNLSVRNKVTMFGGTVYGQIYSAVVPAASYTAFSATAWSSCFTSIGGVLVDESADLNDNVPPGTADVPFAFGAVNDAIYFGNSSPFQRIRVNIGTAGVYDASGVWEYWDGTLSAWTALGSVFDTTDGTIQDGTKSFSRTGSRYIQWQAPETWSSYDIAGDPTGQYWVRWRITSFTSLTTAPSLIQGWYKPVGKANIHGYLVEGLWNGDDIKITLENATAVPAGAGFPAEVYIKRF